MPSAEFAYAITPFVLLGAIAAAKLYEMWRECCYGEIV